MIEVAWIVNFYLDLMFKYVPSPWTWAILVKYPVKMHRRIASCSSREDFISYIFFLLSPYLCYICYYWLLNLLNCFTWLTSSSWIFRACYIVACRSLYYPHTRFLSLTFPWWNRMKKFINVRKSPYFAPTFFFAFRMPRPCPAKSYPCT